MTNRIIEKKKKKNDKLATINHSPYFFCNCLISQNPIYTYRLIKHTESPIIIINRVAYPWNTNSGQATGITYNIENEHIVWCVCITNIIR